MASTYTSEGLEKPANNEQEGTWGDTVNTNTDLISEMVNGVASVSVTTSDVSLTYSTPPVASQSGRHAVLKLTGASTAARTVTVNAIEKVYIVDNQTTGGFDHVLSYGSGQTVTIPNGKVVLVYGDGTNLYSLNYIDGFVLKSGDTMTGTLNLASNGLVVGTDQLVVSGGNVTASGSLTANSLVSTTSISGATLTLSGLATFNGNAVLGSDSADTLTVNATTTFASPATFSGAITAADCTFSGPVTLGDAAADTITVTGTMTVAETTTFQTGLRVINAISTAPNIACSVDTNTGVYFQGSDVMGFTTGGVRAVQIDASQNVAIGTGTASYKLHVAGSIGWAPGASVTPAANGYVAVEATNDTTLTFKLKGSDGTVRSATLSLT